MEHNDISWLNLILGSLILIIPYLVLSYYKTGLVKTFLIAFARMGIQLILVGTYLKFIFSLNSLLLNVAWVLVMMIAATATIIRRTDLTQRKFGLPVGIGVLTGVSVNIALFSLVIVGTERFFNSGYIIPITGMIIGNCLSNAIIAMRSFYYSLVKDEDYYKFSLITSGNRKEAVFPFMRNAIKDAFSPTIASVATMGLIWLPGMMTGQILGGNSPTVAIKYQILIMVAVFASGVITSLVSLLLSQKFVFDGYDMLDKTIFRKMQG